MKKNGKKNLWENKNRDHTTINVDPTKDELAEENNIELKKNPSSNISAEGNTRKEDIHQDELTHPDYTSLEEQLTNAEQKAHEHWETAMRVTAELENVRRRAEREIANTHRYGTEKLLVSLLPIADSLEQALQIVQQSNQDGMYEGIQLTLKLLLDVLEKNGVKQIDPTGLPFNPHEHEAMSIQETIEISSNTIVAVFQKGYKLYERIIRPARVIVAKAPAKSFKEE